MISVNPLGQSGPFETPASKTNNSRTNYHKLDDQIQKLGSSIKTSSVYKAARSFFFLSVPKGKKEEKHYFRLNIKAAVHTISNLKKTMDLGSESDSCIDN